MFFFSVNWLRCCWLINSGFQILKTKSPLIYTATVSFGSCRIISYCPHCMIMSCLPTWLSVLQSISLVSWSSCDVHIDRSCMPLPSAVLQMQVIFHMFLYILLVNHLQSLLLTSTIFLSITVVIPFPLTTCCISVPFSSEVY